MNRANTICFKVFCAGWILICLVAIVVIDGQRILAPIAVNYLPATKTTATAVEPFAIGQTTGLQQTLYSRRYGFDGVESDIYSRTPLYEHSSIQVVYCNWIPWLAVNADSGKGLVANYRNIFSLRAAFTLGFYVVTGLACLYFLRPKQKGA